MPHLLCRVRCGACCLFSFFGLYKTCSHKNAGVGFGAT